MENIRKLTDDAKLVVIDPIFPFIEGILSNNDDVARVMHNFDIVARETGVAYILLNNLTKSGSSADIDAGLGASNLKNIARPLFKLDRIGNILYLESVKNNLAPARGRIGVLFDRLGRPDFIQYAQLEASVNDIEPAEVKESRESGKEMKRAIDFQGEILDKRARKPEYGQAKCRGGRYFYHDTEPRKTAMRQKEQTHIQGIDGMAVTPVRE